MPDAPTSTSRAVGTDSNAREQAAPSELKWSRRLLGLLFAILCFEVGVFLVAFPWSHYWNANYFSTLTEQWHQVWINPYFRGAVSGLGLLNLYVSLSEVFRLQDVRLSRSSGQ